MSAETSPRTGILNQPEARRWIFINILAIGAGILGGLSAIVLNYTIKEFEWLFSTYLLPFLSLQIGGVNFGYLFIPIICIAIISPLLYKYHKEIQGGGVGTLMETMVYRSANIPLRVWPLKLFTSAVTIGAGGSGGPEGPIIQMTGALGSNLAKLFKLTPNEKRVLITCGVAGGMAGIFNAPLGGAIFAIELLLPSFEFYFTVPVMLAGVLGGAIIREIYVTDLIINQIQYPQIYYGEYAIFILFGIIMAIIAFSWLKLFTKSQKIFMKMKVPPILKPVIGIAATGVLVMLLPGLGIGGMGYDGINFAITYSGNITFLLILGIAKMLASSFTITSGSSAGQFAPGLFIGCMFGGFLGSVFDLWFPGLIQNVQVYYVLGMGAFFAAASQEPIGIIILLVEMSNNVWVILPLVITSVISFSLMWLMTKGKNIYTTTQELNNLPIRTDTITLLQSTTVNECNDLERHSLRLNDKLSSYEKYTSQFPPEANILLPILDQGQVVGGIYSKDLVKIPREEWGKIFVEKIYHKVIPFITHQTKILDAIDIMNENDIQGIPIVENTKNKHYEGLFMFANIISKIKEARPLKYS